MSTVTTITEHITIVLISQMENIPVFVKFPIFSVRQRTEKRAKQKQNKNSEKK